MIVHLPAITPRYRSTAKPSAEAVARRQAGGKAATPPPLQAAGNVNAELLRIIRPDAVGNWMMPQLSSMTPAYIETILRGAIGGNHVQQWELFDLMEDTWPRLLKNLNELKGAVIGLDWKLEAWADDDMPPSNDAVERKSIISDALWKMSPASDQDDNGFEQTIQDILDAWAKGVSVLEIIWEQRRTAKMGDLTVPNCTTWVHPRNYAWSQEGFIGLNYTPEVNSTIFGSAGRVNVERFPERKFLVAINKSKSGPVGTSALLRALSWWWCAANFSADWLMNLAQIWGLPFRKAKYAAGTDADVLATARLLLANMGSNPWSLLPDSVDVEILESKATGGSTPQDGLLDRADKYCDLLILGQTLTADTGNSGSGGGSMALGKVHKTVRDQIIQNAANFAARVINQQLIPAILIENYGDAEEAPYFCPEPETIKDTKAQADTIKVAVDTGLNVPTAWAHEELGIPLPQPGEETIQRPTQPSPFGSPFSAPAARPGESAPTDPMADPELQASAALNADQKFALAIADKVDPVVKLITRISEIKDDAVMLQAFQQFLQEAPTIQALVTADVTRQQRALEVVSANALKQGLSQ